MSEEKKPTDNDYLASMNYNLALLVAEFQAAGVTVLILMAVNCVIGVLVLFLLLMVAGLKSP